MDNLSSPPGYGGRSAPEGLAVDDVFDSCTDAAATSRMRQGVFEWESKAELADGLSVTLMISWQPDFDGPLADIVTAARASWKRLRAAEDTYRRALVAEVCRQCQWVHVRPEEIAPVAVWFQPDGSAEIAYGAFVDGEHRIVAEVSPAGEYIGWRVHRVASTSGGGPSKGLPNQRCSRRRKVNGCCHSMAHDHAGIEDISTEAAAVKRLATAQAFEASQMIC
jgi:hypothetical protein